MRYYFLFLLLLAALPLVGNNDCAQAAGEVRDQPGLPAHDDAAREDVAIFKGYVVLLDNDQYGLAGCTSGDWASCDEITPLELGVTELQMIVWATRNTTLLIYGKWDDSPLAVNCFQNVEAVKVTSSCEGLPNESLSWGSLKASYR